MPRTACEVAVGLAQAARRSIAGGRDTRPMMPAAPTPVILARAHVTQRSSSFPPTGGCWPPTRSTSWPGRSARWPWPCSSTGAPAAPLGATALTSSPPSSCRRCSPRCSSPGSISARPRRGAAGALLRPRRCCSSRWRWLASPVLAWPAVLALALLDGVLALGRAGDRPRRDGRGDRARRAAARGQALTNAAFSVCFMAGPALGGAIVAAGGTVPALLINTGLFAVDRARCSPPAHACRPPAGEPVPPPAGVRAALAHIASAAGDPRAARAAGGRAAVLHHLGPGRDRARHALAAHRRRGYGALLAAGAPARWSAARSTRAGARLPARSADLPRRAAALGVGLRA